MRKMLKDHFDIDYAEVDKNINTCLGIIGDLAAFLTYLNDNDDISAEGNLVAVFGSKRQKHNK